MKLKPINALMKFFGRKPEQTLTEFAAEVKELSPEEKHELASLACEEMGAELDESS